MRVMGTGNLLTTKKHFFTIIFLRIKFDNFFTMKFFNNKKTYFLQ